MSRETPAPWSVILCADDYGLSPGVSEAIAGLIDAGRLTATSAMTGSPFWPDHAGWLRPLAGKADVGLHLTLTDQRSLAPLPRLAPDGRLPPLPLLMRQAWAGRVDEGEIAAEIGRQLDAFEEHFGAPPDHVDGHQHVHLLAPVRRPLLAVLRHRYRGAMPYLRDCGDGAAAIVRRRVAVPKTLFIAGLSRPLAEGAARAGAAVNPSFRGIHDFRPDADLAGLFRKFLWPARDGSLVMVHPAQPDRELAGLDTLVEPRYRERDFLAGGQFTELLARAGARPARGRFRPTPAAARPA